MTLLKMLLVVGTGLLGAAAVALPAAAGSEGAPTIEAINRGGGGGVYGEGHEWSPASASVGTGGAVTISNNSSTVAHGVAWVSGPSVPSCSGVPGTAGEPSSGTSWSGTCTFSEPGTYVFYCTVHGSEMTGTVNVAADGTTTSTMTMPGTGTGTGAQPPRAGKSAREWEPGRTGVGTPDRQTRFAAGGRRCDGGQVGPRAARQGGARIVGGLTGGRRRTPRGGPAGDPRHPRRGGGRAGSVRRVRAARRALARRGRLALSVRIVLTRASGAATTVSRSVHLRKPG